jgi:hypothetical protein
MMSDPPQKDPALELFVVLFRANTWVNAYAARDARCHGMNPTEFAILEALYHKGALPLLSEITTFIDAGAVYAGGVHRSTFEGSGTGADLAGLGHARGKIVLRVVA